MGAVQQLTVDDGVDTGVRGNVVGAPAVTSRGDGGLPVPLGAPFPIIMGVEASAT